MKDEKKIKERIDNVRLHDWQILDLKNCGLDEIPDEIFDFRDLTIIDLSNDPYCDEGYKNNIEVIPTEFQI